MECGSDSAYSISTGIGLVRSRPVQWFARAVVLVEEGYQCLAAPVGIAHKLKCPIELGCVGPLKPSGNAIIIHEGIVSHSVV